MRTNLILISFSLSVSGGSESGVGREYFEAALALAEEFNLSLYLITTDSGNENFLLDIDSKANRFTFPFEIIKVKSGSKSNFLTRRLSYLKFLIRSRKPIRELLKLDARRSIIHQVTYSTELVPPAFMSIAKYPHTRYIWGPVGSHGNASLTKLLPGCANSFLANILQKLRDTLSRIVLPMFSKHLDVLLLNNPSLIEYSRSTTSIFFPNFVKQGEISRLTKPLAKSREITKIAIVGVLENRKLPLLPIEIMKMDPRLKVKFVYFGDGSKRRELDREIKNHLLQDYIHIRGNLSRPDLFKELEDFDALMLLSYREGSPWAIGEALQLGLPVISFSNTGSEDLLKYYNQVAHVINLSDVSPNKHQMLAEIHKSLEAVIENLMVSRVESIDLVDRAELIKNMKLWYGF